MNDVLGVHNHHLVMLPTVHLKDEIEPDQVSTTLVYFT